MTVENTKEIWVVRDNVYVLLGSSAVVHTSFVVCIRMFVEWTREIIFTPMYAMLSLLVIYSVRCLLLARPFSVFETAVRAVLMNHMF